MRVLNTFIPHIMGIIGYLVYLLLFAQWAQHRLPERFVLIIWFEAYADNKNYSYC